MPLNSDSTMINAETAENGRYWTRTSDPQRVEKLPLAFRECPLLAQNGGHRPSFLRLKCLDERAANAVCLSSHVNVSHRGTDAGVAEHLGDQWQRHFIFDCIASHRMTQSAETSKVLAADLFPQPLYPLAKRIAVPLRTACVDEYPTLMRAVSPDPREEFDKRRMEHYDSGKFLLSSLDCLVLPEGQCAESFVIELPFGVRPFRWPAAGKPEKDNDPTKDGLAVPQDGLPFVVIHFAGRLAFRMRHAFKRVVRNHPGGFDGPIERALDVVHDAEPRPITFEFRVRVKPSNQVERCAIGNRLAAVVRSKHADSFVENRLCPGLNWMVRKEARNNIADGNRRVAIGERTVGQRFQAEGLPVASQGTEVSFARFGPVTGRASLTRSVPGGINAQLTAARNDPYDTTDVYG